MENKIGSQKGDMIPLLVVTKLLLLSVLLVIVTKLLLLLSYRIETSRFI